MTPPKQLTPWFPGNVKPVHKGMYERTTTEGHIIWSKWDGEFWGAYSTNFLLAQERVKASMFQDWKWRGIAEDPAKGGAA